MVKKKSGKRMWSKKVVVKKVTKIEKKNGGQKKW